MPKKPAPRRDAIHRVSKPRPKSKLPEVLPPRYDIVFKQIFGTRPDLLKPMLQSMIALPAGDFGKIVIVDPHIYPEYKGEKLGVLDIKVTLRSKKVINVELQQKKIAHLRERLVYYCAGMVREQVVTGDGYDKLKRVVSIAITNHVVIADAAYHHRYTLYDPETGSEFTDLIEVHVIELPKLPQKDDGSDLWWWAKFLTVKTKEELAMVATKSTALKKAAERLMLVSEDIHLRTRLERQRLFEMDQRVMMREAVEAAVGKAERKAKRELSAERRKAEAAVSAERRKAEDARKKVQEAQKKAEKILDLIKQGYPVDQVEKMIRKKGRV